MKTLLTIAPLALLAACGQTATATADRDAMASSPAMAAPADDATYLAMAGASDMFEIESSKAVMAKTSNAAVQDFARMMIAHHSDSTARVKAAAAQAGLTVPPPQLTADQRAKLAAVTSATGDAAARTYIAGQREAHAAALTLHQGYAQNGRTPALRAVAAQIVPVVQGHITMLANMREI
ncbi:DUF4142 domain-containing protein [Roseomonas aeriglobus]|nr:DUF4142 domain-containing protein [Roseomonas aeriglobus]